MIKKQVLRKCVGCGQTMEKTNLVRVLKTFDTCEIIIMPTSKHFGRSVYVCYNKDCLKNAMRKRKLQKALKKEISASTLQHLEGIINK